MGYSLCTLYFIFSWVEIDLIPHLYFLGGIFNAPFSVHAVGYQAGGTECSLTFFTGKFLLTYREKRDKKGKIRGKEGKFEREEVKISRGPFFFFFFFFFFACHFFKPLKFVWGLPKWAVFTGKKHISRWEKIRKSDFSPSEKYSSYTEYMSVIYKKKKLVYIYRV